MKTYIGTKIIKAEPAYKEIDPYDGTTELVTHKEYSLGIKHLSSKAKDGYKVVYPDGYTSWSPKDVFEQSYHDVSDMIVFKEDSVARKNDDNTLTPYEVICADENVFVIAPISLNDDGSYTPDYEKLEAYSNDKIINTLDALNFVKLEDK